jgi:hypothetical protein
MTIGHLHHRGDGYSGNRGGLKHQHGHVRPRMFADADTKGQARADLVGA